MPNESIVDQFTAQVERFGGPGLLAKAFTPRPTLLLDWRCYQALSNTRGSSFMPFSIGLGF